MPTGVPDWYRVRGIAGYDVVRIVLGAILLTAAALKGHKLATEPVVETGLFTSRWFLIGVVEFELFFGLWLVAGLYPKWTWAAAFCCFVLLAGVSLWKGLSGEATCGCFGRVPVNPWYTFTLDAAAVAALLYWRPNREASQARQLFGGVPVGVRSVAALWVLAGAPAAVAMGSYQAGMISETGEIFGDSEFVVLEPEKWVGKRFPLLKYIDVGDRLAYGEWIVVLYHHDCPKCREVIRRYEEMGRHSASRPAGPPVALVEMFPYPEARPRVEGGSGVCLTGRLSRRRVWFLETPGVVVLDEGIVRKAANGGEGEILQPRGEAALRRTGGFEFAVASRLSIAGSREADAGDARPSTECFLPSLGRDSWLLF
ncbi:MAG: MauE/DoxX family redox-associated membrane protein [Planctomycetota bacterium]|jgi:hypothetical protein